MKLYATGKHRGQFDVLAATRSSEAAMMTLAPGASSSDELENEHAWAEQWLYVVSGTGRARVGTRTVALRAGSALLIPKNVPHRITNTGRSRLVTFNVYAPPAYDADGEPRRPTSRSLGRRSRSRSS